MNNCKGNIRKCTCNSSGHSGLDPGDKSSCGCGGSCKCAEKLNNIIEGESLPLSRVKEGQSCKVVFVRSSKREDLCKILISVWPGMEMKIVQKRPFHVFMMKNTQISVDNEIAESIYVGGLE